MEIGDYCLIAHEVVIADEAHGVPRAPVSARGEGKEKRGITIGMNCWIATGAILLEGARIGNDAIVGAHTVVDFEIPAGTMVVGNPPRILDLPRASTS